MNAPVSTLLAKLTLPVSFDDDQEEYILTDEEAQEAIHNELIRLEKVYAWKLHDKGVHTKQQILAKIDEIDFSKKIDVVEVLERANSNKLYEIWQRGQRDNEKLAAEKKLLDLKTTWTANRIYQLIKWTSDKAHGKPLLVNNDTMSIIKPLCYFLSEDERFETELGHSFKKGILFRGISGLGKTHIVVCASENERNPIYFTSIIDIYRQVKDGGKFFFPNGFSKYYIDDVGTEDSSVVNHYGTKINWFKDFIETYYLRRDFYNRIILSTNNTPDEFEDKYGFRVRSRIKEMFNVIDAKGIDLRS